MRERLTGRPAHGRIRVLAQPKNKKHAKIDGSSTSLLNRIQIGTLAILALTFMGGGQLLNPTIQGEH